MHISFEEMVYYMVFADALFAVFLAWSGRAETIDRKFALFTQLLPLTRGWTFYYLVLVVWLGFALTRLQVV